MIPRIVVLEQIFLVTYILQVYSRYLEKSKPILPAMILCRIITHIRMEN